MSLYHWPLLRGIAETGVVLARPGDTCAGCQLPVADCDAAYTEAGQRLHRDGCSIDEAPRLRLVRA